MALRLASLGSRENSARSFSISGTASQPNQALSPAPPSTEDTAGDTVSNNVDQVWKMFQPPCGGGSFFARRATIVDQSIAWRSALAPIERSISTVTSAGACAYGESVGSRTTMGRPSYPDSFSSCLAFSRSGLTAPAEDS